MIHDVQSHQPKCHTLYNSISRGKKTTTKKPNGFGFHDRTEITDEMQKNLDRIASKFA